MYNYHYSTAFRIVRISDDPAAEAGRLLQQRLNDQERQLRRNEP